MRGRVSAVRFLCAVFVLTALVAFGACSSENTAGGDDVAVPETETDETQAPEARCKDERWIERHDGESWVEEDCGESLGWFCDADQAACVPPWLYGTPSFAQCEDDPHATPESLAEKAAIYESLAANLQVHPELMWVTPVTLAAAEVPCEAGEPPRASLGWRSSIRSC